MEHISRTDKVSNEEVIPRKVERRQVVNIIRNRQKRWMEHISRTDKVSNDEVITRKGEIRQVVTSLGIDRRDGWSTSHGRTRLPTRR